MNRLGLKKIRILERALNTPVMSSLTRALRPLRGPHFGSHSNCSTPAKKSPVPYIPYEDFRRTRLQMLEVEEGQAEVMAHFRRRAY